MTNLPHSKELEAAILGAILQDKHAIYTALEIIDRDSFYDPNHSAVFASILTLYDESKPIDLLTVTNQLKSDGQLEAVGGPYFVSTLTDNASGKGSLAEHCRIVQQKYMKRRQAVLANELQKMASDETVDPFDTDDFISREQLDISNRVIRGSEYKTLKDIAPDVYRAIDLAGKSKGLTGIPTGIHEKDRVYGGRQNTDLIIKAGRPGMGKTSDALCEGLHAAKEGHNVVFFSLEMGRTQLMQRLTSIESGVDLILLRRGGLAPSQMQSVHEAIGVLEKLPFKIIDKAAISIREISVLSARLKAMNLCDIIFIDYLQLITTTDNGRQNREQEISLISRSLKRLAKDLDVPVVALSQLNRSVESRGGMKKPQLSDLRESGAIEQDADIVEFVYRPEYYGFLQDEGGESLVGVGFLLIEKHRNGSTGMVKMKWDGSLTKYDNFDSYAHKTNELKQNTNFDNEGDEDELPF